MKAKLTQSGTRFCISVLLNVEISPLCLAAAESVVLSKRESEGFNIPLRIPPGGLAWDFIDIKRWGWTYWGVCFGGMDPLGPDNLVSMVWTLILNVFGYLSALVSVIHCNEDKRVIL